MSIGANTIVLQSENAHLKKFDTFDRDHMEESHGVDTWIHEPIPEDFNYNTWQATTQKVEGHDFKWDACGAADISKVNMIRLEVRG